MGRICVVGSANVDYVVEVEQLPRPGETVSGSDLMTTYGGKGANQAVAAARLGGRVSFVARFGDDAAGEAYREHLKGEGIDLPLAEPASGVPNGCALILVDSGGGNIIAVSPGANRHLRPTDVDRCASSIRSADLLVLQAEVPVDTIVHAMKIASESGVRILFNPAPVPVDFPWKDVQIDCLVLNETEAERILGAPIGDAEALDAARGRFPHASCLVVTRGSEPTLAADAGHTCTVPTLPVTPVDTVGAGDAFTGALAVAMVEAKGLYEALAFANGAGGLASTRRGAQVSLPDRAEVETAVADALKSS